METHKTRETAKDSMAWASQVDNEFFVNLFLLKLLKKEMLS